MVLLIERGCRERNKFLERWGRRIGFSFVPSRCVVHLEYLKRDVQDIIGNRAQGLAERLKMKGKLKSWVSHVLN